MKRMNIKKVNEVLDIRQINYSELLNNKNFKFIKISKKATGGKYGKTIITDSP